MIPATYFKAEWCRVYRNKDPIPLGLKEGYTFDLVFEQNSFPQITQITQITQKKNADLTDQFPH